MGIKPFLAACHIFTICIVFFYFCNVVANKVLSLSLSPVAAVTPSLPMSPSIAIELDYEDKYMGVFLAGCYHQTW